MPRSAPAGSVLITWRKLSSLRGKLTVCPTRKTNYDTRLRPDVSFPVVGYCKIQTSPEVSSSLTAYESIASGRQFQHLQVDRSTSERMLCFACHIASFISSQRSTTIASDQDRIRWSKP